MQLKPHQLPIQHPDYRYPPSRNPYWEKLKDLEGKVYSDNETEQFAGKWRAHVPDTLLAGTKEAVEATGGASSPAGSGRELHVEIGCNAGHVILEWAKAKPEAAFVGIDWKFKSIFRAAEKAQKGGVNNLLLFRAHAERAEFMFGPQEIDFLYLFFPDPWPRKSQWKNRFVSAERLRSLAKLMKPGGVFHIKTDHPGYFEWMLQALEECLECWSVIEKTTDLHRGHPAPQSLKIPEVTLFERIFIREGIPINSLKLQRRG